MSKPAHRPLSRYTLDAVVLLGQTIRQARIAKKLTTAELAEQAGVSRGLIQRIEKGDPGCTVGAMFEAAVIVGVPLFDIGETTMGRAIGVSNTILTLQPTAVRAPKLKAGDDF